MEENNVSPVVDPSATEDVTITYVLHSCFVAETERAVIVFDYWKDAPDGRLHALLEQTQKQVYFVHSHYHPDHFNPDVLTWNVGAYHQPILLLGADIVRRYRVESPRVALSMRAGDSYEDAELRLLAFRSTDVGVSVGVTLRGTGTTLFHAGDLNNWYFAAGDIRLKVLPDEMEGLFMSVLREIMATYPRIDHLMFPVDTRLGDNMLRGLAQFVHHVECRHVYPMHYWEGYEAMCSNVVMLRDMFPKTTFHLPEAALCVALPDEARNDNTSAQ